MKKTILRFTALAVALSFISCGVETLESPEAPQTEASEEGEGDFIVEIQASMPETDIDTRTEFYNNTIRWGEGDVVYFAQYIPGQSSLKTTVNTALTSAMNKISLSTSRFVDPGEDDAYYVSAFPYQSYVGYNYSANSRMMWKMKTGDVQVPTATGYDPNADLLISDYVKNLEKNAEGKYPLLFSYKRMIAISKMTLFNLPSSSDVKSVEFSAADGGSDVILAGERFYDFELGSAETPTEKKYSISLDYSAESVSASGSEGMTAYFCCYPFELGEGDTFKVVVTTEAGEVFTKDVTIPASRSLIFEAGRGTKFSVDMSSSYKTGCSSLASSPLSQETGKDGVALKVREGAEITGLKYLLVKKSEFDSIGNLDEYVSEEDASFTQVSSSNIAKINGGASFSLSFPSLGETYVCIFKVTTAEKSEVFISGPIKTRWLSISGSTSSTKGGYIAVKFIGKDIKSVDYVFVKMSEAPSAIDLIYFDSLEKSGSLPSSNISNINSGGSTGSNLRLQKLDPSTKYLVMVKATSTSDEVSFVYQKDVTSSAAE